MGFLVEAKPSARLRTVALALASVSFEPTSASGQATQTFLTGFQIERLANQGIKLVSKNPNNSYTLTVLGSNVETNPQYPQSGDAWQKSLGVEAEGKLGNLLKTELRTRFTELDSNVDAAQPALLAAGAFVTDRRMLEEFSLSTKVLGDRLAVTSSRRTSDHVGVGLNQKGRRNGSYAQDQFTAWIWRSDRSSLSLEGVESRVSSGFQANFSQPVFSNSEDTQQLRSKFSLGRAEISMAQRDMSQFKPDRSAVTSQVSAIESTASLGLSDLRRGARLLLLPDSVWISTSSGTMGKDDDASHLRPMQKSAVGMTRKWEGASINFSYSRSAIEPSVSLADGVLWRGRGVDLGGTLKSGALSVSGNASWLAADTLAALNTSVETTFNGSLFVSWSPDAWPKVSVGVTNYAYQSVLFEQVGLEQRSLARYEFAVDSSQLLSVWKAREAQLRFIASYQANGSRSRWAKGHNTSAENLVFGFKFAQSLNP